MTRPRNPWPIAIGAFFTLFLAFTVGLVVFSVRQTSELVSPDYYAQELAFQRQIERVGRTQTIQAQVKVAYDPARQQLTLSMPADQARQQPTGAIRLYRPSAAGLDRELRLEVDASGTQVLDVPSLRPGLWRVRILWRVAGAEYYCDRQLVVRLTPTRSRAAIPRPRRPAQAGAQAEPGNHGKRWWCSVVPLDASLPLNAPRLAG